MKAEVKNIKTEAVEGSTGKCHYSECHKKILRDSLRCMLWDPSVE